MITSAYDFSSIRLKIASPEAMGPREHGGWSYGEVTKSETINYRTQRPEKDGLFSERIFGPTKDWECYCGKYRRIRYKGVVCDKCGVEVTRSVVRRERMGHISLAAPVAHIWYFRNTPSKLALLLDVPVPKLEKVIYYAAYIVTAVHTDSQEKALEQIEAEFKSRKKTVADEGIDIDALKSAMSDTKKEIADLRIGRVLSESEYHQLASKFGNVFEAGMGAAALQKILRQLDLKKFVAEIKKEIRRDEIKDETVKEARAMKRLKVASSMQKHGMRPDWMILTVLPVLPPDLRPMVALDGGRYATSDLNDLYRRVINRNNRLKKLMELKAPEVIVVNEKRMLQEAVDALVDNSARAGSQQMSSQRRPLRSLADMLKGKQGRFRQNLLGKRVDYSGRSVIVVGPELKLHQCGLPKKMALELFRPFVIAKIIERGLAHNVKNSNRLIEAAGPEIWAILEEVIKNRKVLLNRAPTLHRLGIQAFEPILIEDLAIHLHPLVCTAFNADFDGDQMAVHLPLSEEAQKEASEIMLSSRNLLKPATGEPIVNPTQDIVLGVYFLTKVNPQANGAGRVYGSRSEVMHANEAGVLAINAPITLFENGQKIETSLGRIFFNEALPSVLGFVNKQINKKDLGKLIGRIIKLVGIDGTPQYLDAIKDLGYKHVTTAGITWSIADLQSPKEKPEIIAEAEKQVAEIREQYLSGFLTDNERRARVIAIWTDVKNKIAKLVPTTLHQFGSIYNIVDSGARGSWAQITQVVGMKGLVQNSRSETIELPILSSFREGLDALEFFIATHGARKGTTDTALKTAAAGYLTRRLVDVSQDLVIREDDCRTKEGVLITRADGLEYGHQFNDRLFSRTVLSDVKIGGKVAVAAGEQIDHAISEAINAEPSITEVMVRSPITCKTLYGICSKCYGYDLGKNKLIEKGEAIGVVAAQSIGEPGTQLTMRTFHVGGIAGADITNGLPRVVEIFEVRPPKGRAFMALEDGVVTEIENKDLLKVIKITTLGGKSVKGGKAKVDEYPIPSSSDLFVKVGDEVKKGQKICEGNVDLRELFELKGRDEVEKEIVRGVQKIYISEGAPISNKHLEIIVRQMFSRVKIRDAGDSEFIEGEVIEKSRFMEINRGLKKAGKTPAKAKQLLLGITKVALSTESFLSAASFQETARVLINAAIEGKVDTLRGLKENVIIGRAIPVGKNYNGTAFAPEEDETEEAR